MVLIMPNITMPAKLKRIKYRFIFRTLIILISVSDCGIILRKIKQRTTAEKSQPAALKS
jgi:hypothetical protein